jgi:hypothetical protein
VDLSKIRHKAEFVITHYFRVITKYLPISSFQDSEAITTSIYHRPSAHGGNATQSAFKEWVFCRRALTTVLDKTFRKLLAEIKKRRYIDPRF